MIRLRPSGVDEILIKRVQDWYEPGPGVFVQSLTASFSPAMLFTGTTTGAWYDPSDYSTLFQNAAGTTPVTAVEQPVGLMLDKSKKLVLGPELVTNGDFSTDTGWTKAVGVVIAGGVANFTAVASSSALYQNISSIAVGNFYSVTYTLTVVSGSVQTQINGNTAAPSRVSSGTYTDILNVSAATNKNFIFIANNFTGSIDNISIRELPGNHAFNGSGNSANFPVLSARYNLLTKSEQFDDVAWSKGNSAVTANAAVAPDGTTTADLLYPLTSGVDRRVIQTNLVLSVVNYTASAYIKAAGKTWAYMLVPQATSINDVVWFNLSTGAVGTKGSSAVSASMQDVGNGWYKCTVTGLGSANSAFAINVSDADNSTSVTASGTSGIYIWGADLRVANDALNQPAYQRVNTSTDYDTVGFKPYLRFNGTNQWLQTNSIDFTYGDKMFVSAGVRKLSDAGNAVVVELSADGTANNGIFNIFAPIAGAASYRFVSKGTAAGSAISPLASYPAPNTAVLAGVGSISTDTDDLRVNGTSFTGGILDQGTGNYGNYPLFIGARAGTSQWFNGRLYGLVVAGKQASAAEITSTETYINQKTGAYA